LIKVKKKVF